EFRRVLFRSSDVYGVVACRSGGERGHSRSGVDAGRRDSALLFAVVSDLAGASGARAVRVCVFQLRVEAAGERGLLPDRHYRFSGGPDFSAADPPRVVRDGYGYGGASFGPCY